MGKKLLHAIEPANHKVATSADHERAQSLHFLRHHISSSLNVTHSLVECIAWTLYFKDADYTSPSCETRMAESSLSKLQDYGGNTMPNSMGLSHA
jgi:hypothetical protein